MIHAGEYHRAAAARGSGLAQGRWVGGLGISEQSYYPWRSEYGGLRLEVPRNVFDQLAAAISRSSPRTRCCNNRLSKRGGEIGSSVMSAPRAR
jgi:hypothetical protein